MQAVAHLLCVCIAAALVRLNTDTDMSAAGGSAAILLASPLHRYWKAY